MNSIYFTEEHQLFRTSLRDFLQKEVVPHIEKWEKTGTIERFIWKKFGESRENIPTKISQTIRILASFKNFFIFI